MNTDSYSFQSTEDIYDTDRNATALDTSTKLTLEDAIAIKQKNYTDVGRYLTNASSIGLDKALTLDEMEILIAVGLNVFPIFQTIGNKVSYFTAQQGLADGLAAKEAAQKFGFPPSATIYFCVDYDVLMADIEGNILPWVCRKSWDLIIPLPDILLPKTCLIVFVLTNTPRQRLLVDLLPHMIMVPRYLPANSAISLKWLKYIMEMVRHINLN